MRIAAALFVAAAAFAWLAARGVVRLGSTGSAPPAIVLRGAAFDASVPGRGGRLAVPRKVERAPLRSFHGDRSRG